MTSVAHLQGLINQLENEIGGLSRENAYLSSQIDQLNRIINDSRRYIQDLEKRMQEMEIHFNRERARMRAEIEQAQREHDRRLAQIEREFREVNEALKAELESERQRRIAEYQRLQTEFERQRQELEEYQRQVEQRFEEERRYLQSSIEQLQRALQESEERQRKAIKELDEKFEQYIKEKDEAAADDIERANRLILSIYDDIAQYSTEARAVDACDQVYRLEARLELIATEMLRVRNAATEAIRRSTSSRILIHTLSAHSDSRALKRYIEYRLGLMQHVMSENCMKCSELREKFHELRSNFFPEIMEYQKILNDLAHEIRETYRKWRTFERLRDVHNTIIREMEVQAFRLPELIKSAEAQDARRRQIGRALLSSFKEALGFKPDGNLHPGVTNENDYRSDRRIKIFVGSQNINFTLSLNGSYQINGSPDLINPLTYFLGHHPIPNGSETQFPDYYSPQIALQAIMDRINEHKRLTIY